MTDREKLIELLENAESAVYWSSNDKGYIQKIADHLISNGVTITPAVPGPSVDDPNIMELCFHNGENHMRDKIKASLLKLSGDMTCVTISQVIKIMEDL
jgi:hypothetical protein